MDNFTIGKLTGLRKHRLGDQATVRLGFPGDKSEGKELLSQQMG